jgi:hypothetical protein
MDLHFDFSDIPLLSTGDLVTGFVEGHAEITVQDDGGWIIDKIFLVGHRKGKYETFQLERFSPHFHTVYLELESGSWRDAINDAVSNALEEEGVSVRPLHSEHSTLHAAE